MIQGREEFSYGQVLRHFKWHFLSEEEKASTLKYLYMYGDTVTHSETRETLVRYLCLANRQWYVRPIDMFYSRVDRKKYPDARQEYRFEPV